MKLFLSHLIIFQLHYGVKETHFLDYLLLYLRIQGKKGQITFSQSFSVIGVGVLSNVVIFRMVKVSFATKT